MTGVQTCALPIFGDHMKLFATPIVLTMLVSSLSAAEIPVDQAGYTKIVAPFFTKYCQKCHDSKKPEGEFAVDSQRLPNNFADPGTRSRWGEIVNVLNSHEMPPEKEKQPGSDEVAKLVDWITTQTVQAELVLRERSVVLRRLNNNEYRNTIDRKSTRLNSSHIPLSRMPSSA